MAVKLDKIYQDCSHPDPQIQTFALMSITRLSPQLVDAPDQIEKIVDKLKQLMASKNPDVVFLARKAVNHLEVQFKQYLQKAPPPPPPPSPAEEVTPKPMGMGLEAMLNLDGPV